MDEFEAHRPRLHAVATRSLGSGEKPRPMTRFQEAWLPVDRADGSEVATSPGG